MLPASQLDRFMLQLSMGYPNRASTAALLKDRHHVDPLSACQTVTSPAELEKLIAEHKCSQCHATKWADDGKAVYRPLGRINTPGLLRGMVEQCNTELNMGLFPEEVTAIAAVLNRDHYRFGP